MSIGNVGFLHFSKVYVAISAFISKLTGFGFSVKNDVACTGPCRLRIWPAGSVALCIHQGTL